MTTAIATLPDSGIIEQVLLSGDLARLTADQRLSYYKAVCDSVGLNPLTQPFEYLTLNNRLRLYARKDATDQLRRLHKISIEIRGRETTAGAFVVVARASMPDGRTDESIGATPVEGLKGESLTNAMMKAETKAKRRATLSLCGLGMLDESEVDSIESYGPRQPAAPAPKAPVHATAVVTNSAPASGGSTSSAPAAKPADKPFDDPDRVAAIAKLRRLMLDKAPNGHDMHPKHGEAWLLKYFGRKRPIDMTKAQANDAILLLECRLKTPELYGAWLEQFHAEKRILSSEFLAAVKS